MTVTVTPNHVVEYGQSLVQDSRSAAPTVRSASISWNLGNTSVNRVLTPNWRDKVHAGLDASNPYSMSLYKLKSQGRLLRPAGSTLNRYQPGYRIDVSGIYKLVGQPQLPSENFNDEVRNRAIAKFKSQLQGRTGSFRAMAPIAEMRELGGLVKQAVFSTTEFALACLEAKRTKGRSFGRFMQKSWLGYSFAVSPLIADIGEAGNAIAKYLARTDMDVRLRSTATKQWLYSYTPSTAISPDGLIGFSLVRKAFGVATLSYRYVGGIGLALRSSNEYTLLEQFGIGFEHIPTLAWELTAFSWLFDYFVNIGDFLDDTFVQPPGQTRYLVENRMLKCEIDHEFLLTAKGNLNGITPSHEPESRSRISYVSFQRTPLTAMPHVSLRVKTPGEMSGYGIPKLLNLVSLLKI